APVRSDAQALAGTIPHMTTTRTSDWTRMRTGITGGTIVYVVPAERGAKGRGNDRKRRPKFKSVLGPRMDLALERNRGHVMRRLDQMLYEVGKVWDRNGLR
ncbi:MAG TPA: hypothetical protein VJW75_07060, partial [Candidatus Eisenbacteria bacterium]|nr:hypothetical protein [Candidatus Eisenbacteria bacterium]